MIGAAVLTAVLTLSGPVDRFWERDLFGTVRALADQSHRVGDHAGLVTDLVRLAQCEPLPPVPTQAPDRAARLLVRLEAARGGRMGEGARSSTTLWRDLYTPAFFRRVPQVKAGALVWPVEDERWPDEALNFQLTPGCVAVPAAAGDELTLLPPAIAAALASPGLEGIAATTSYQLTVLQLRAGKLEAAQASAALLDPARLEPIPSANARLMRLELGIDPPEGYLELVALPELQPVDLHVRARASGVLIGQGRYLAAVEVTTPALEAALAPSRTPGGIAQDLLCRHLTALVGAGRLDPAVAILPRTLKTGAPETEPSMQCLRELALELASLRKLDTFTEQLIALAGPAEKDGERWVEAGSRALARRQLEVAHALATRATTFGPGRARQGGDILLAEIAWARGDLEGFATRLAALYGKQGRESARLRGDREKAALVAGAALVNRMEQQPLPELRTRLLEALRTFRKEALRKNQPAAEALLAAGEKRARSAAKGSTVVAVVAVGDIQVTFQPPRMAPTASPVDYPEPYSLLAVPAPDGSFHPWVPATAAAVEVSDAT